MSASKRRKRGLTAPEPGSRSFDEAFAELNLTPAERKAMVWHLAAFRARKTVEALLPETAIEARLGFDPSIILRDGDQAQPDLMFPESASGDTK